jgi:hypothetical protein
LTACAAPGRCDNQMMRLVLTHKAKAVWKKIDGKKLIQDKQPKWQSDHYFSAAAAKLS